MSMRRTGTGTHPQRTNSGGVANTQPSSGRAPIYIIGYLTRDEATREARAPGAAAPPHSVNPAANAGSW